jgi:acetyl-CoA C-acetyltransferase
MQGGFAIFATTVGVLLSSQVGPCLREATEGLQEAERDMAMEEVVIVSAARTPVGKFQGSLSSYTATQLGSLAVREAVRRAGVAAELVEECIMGNVVSAGLGQNPARQAALGGGLPPEVSAMTINKVCGSGLKAVALAAQAIQTGNAEILVAGGMESMSNAPYLLPQGRNGFRMGDAKVVDSMIWDGLWDVFNDYHMGVTGENVAEKHSITREQQDAYALGSHQKATAAERAGAFKDEILPVEIPAKKKGEAPGMLTRDESVRADASIEGLRALKPAFRKDGTVTAGNAPGVNDGAGAVVVMSARKAAALKLTPMVRIVAQATSGVDPKWVMLAPVIGVQRVLAKAGWKKEDVDLYELNEAFAVQALGVMKELGLDTPELAARVNVNGGSVAIGHPIGGSGARVLTTLIHAMMHRNKRRGVAALCLGGGNSVAMAVERV